MFPRSSCACRRMGGRFAFVGSPSRGPFDTLRVNGSTVGHRFLAIGFPASAGRFPFVLSLSKDGRTLPSEVHCAALRTFDGLRVRVNERQERDQPLSSRDFTSPDRQDPLNLTSDGEGSAGGMGRRPE